MADEYMATYLNDHLAGSVLALELLDRLEATHSESDLIAFFRQLRAEITADRVELQGLMERLDIGESRTRKASAWLAEKITELKLRFDDPEGGPLRLFESLEALSLGIEGKRSLWIALAAATEVSPSLKIVDYERLRQRAEEQRDRVERLRIDTAKEALRFPATRQSYLKCRGVSTHQPSRWHGLPLKSCFHRWRRLAAGLCQDGTFRYAHPARTRRKARGSRGCLRVRITAPPGYSAMVSPASSASPVALTQSSSLA